jgi:hypothetical protein
MELRGPSRSWVCLEAYFVLGTQYVVLGTPEGNVGDGLAVL